MTSDDEVTPKDRPILAAAAAVNARFVITENVRDFGATDLRTLLMSAVHPDLFLTSRVTEQIYRFVLDAIAANRSREPELWPQFPAGYCSQGPTFGRSVLGGHRPWCNRAACR